jgi:hypothetical protein
MRGYEGVEPPPARPSKMARIPHLNLVWADIRAESMIVDGVAAVRGLGRVLDVTVRAQPLGPAVSRIAP